MENLKLFIWYNMENFIIQELKIWPYFLLFLNVVGKHVIGETLSNWKTENVFWSFFNEKKNPITKTFFDVKISLAGLFSEEYPQKVTRPFWRKSKKLKKYPQKALTILLEKYKKLKMSSKNVTVLLEKGEKVKNIPKKRYGPSVKKVKEMKNVLKKRYGPSGKKVKNRKMSSKRVTVVLVLRII